MISVKLLHPRATFSRAHNGSIGFDLTCCEVSHDPSSGLHYLHLGVATAGPAFFLLPRSSFPKTGWALANSIGLIDPDYRGEWIAQVYLWTGNWYPEGFCAAHIVDAKDFIGRRVMQAVPLARSTPEVQIVTSLPPSERGAGGLGSTGE